MKKPLLRVVGLQHLPGFAWGFRSPGLRLDAIVSSGHVNIPAKLATLFSTLEEAIDRAGLNANDFAVSEPLSPTPSASATYPLEALLHWIRSSLLIANVPILERGHILDSSGKHHSAAIPIFLMPFATMKMIIDHLVKLINLAATAAPPEAEIQSFLHLIRQVRGTTQTGSNVPRFLKAAFELDIQTTYVAGNIIQYGQGAHARWLDSSFTDATPSIGAGTARNKILANSVLRQAGIPVAQQAVALSADHAVTEAQKIGYPVVIKPADTDGGIAVHAGLMSGQEVRNAYLSARKHSRNIIVEKHIEGRDYRINTYGTEVLWAIERVPAGVTGDGTSTLRQLVERENLNPMRNQGANSPLKPLALDEEALQTLEKAGLHPGSIPAAGHFVPLRRRANIGMGGMPMSVMDKLHPDNARLAVRSAALLGLDVAGVDLMLPDIEQSWLETGGAVCEVNGQPQLGAVTSMHTYKELLQKLVPARGRIPIALVIGHGTFRDLVARVAKLMADEGFRPGWSDGTHVFVRDERIHPGDTTTYLAGKMLMLNREVEAAILWVDEKTLPATGLPFDRYDLLVMGERDTQSATDSGGEDILAMILPACTGKVLTVTRDGFTPASPKCEGSVPWRPVAGPPEQLAKTVLQELLAGRAAGDGL